MSVNSVSFGQNPDDYAKTYAAQNNLSVEEAKQELKSKYGDPQQDGGNISSIFGDSATALISNENQITSWLDVPFMDPDAYAQQYADENGITLDEAKEKLGELYGDPEEMFSKDVDPDYYVKLYASENNITYEEAKEYFENNFGIFE